MSIPALFGHPSINDITTTPEAPPAFQALAQVTENAKRDLGYPKQFAPTQKKFYSDISPFILKSPPDKAFEHILTAARLMPNWNIVAQDKTTYRLEAIAVTKLMKFKDDVVVEIRPGQNGTASVHMRSKSRLGRNDFGANAKRIRQFFETLEQVSGEKGPL